jgi:SpoVK/Ycf46/Vps4 family AAA+-type ATPase
MLAQIFQKARQEAPCFLVFEDLDSVISDNIRSFFLNEVDGLSNNDGILMVGSTNHLERLDPGIAKRPSRFDRKYYFPNPDEAERIKYCEYWQGKLSGNKDIDFPHRLCTAIADITDGFSFAYMQEAFVASLLIIASRKEKSASSRWNQRRGRQMWHDSSDEVVDSGAPNGGGDSDLDKFILWREIKLQIKLLRESLEGQTVLSKCNPAFGKMIPRVISPPPAPQLPTIATPESAKPTVCRKSPSLGVGATLGALKTTQTPAPFPHPEPNPNIPTRGIPKPASGDDGMHRHAAAAERERLGKSQAVQDMQAALEADGDPYQLQHLKRAAEDYLSWFQ